MEKEVTRRSKEQTPPTRSSPTTVDDIPDHLLRLIFGRLGSHVWFVRAAAVCARWRCIASTRSMKYRDCYPHEFSTIIGHYHILDPSLSPGQRERALPVKQQRSAVFVPASPSIDASHFALDFLPPCPGRRPWELVDCSGCLLLLASSHRHGFFPDLLVCEPISRRYVMIKPTDDMKYCNCLGVYLNAISSVMSISSFSMTCILHERPLGIADGSVTFVTARVYTQEPPWLRRCRHGWSSSRIARSNGILIRGVESAHFAGRSKWLIFWGIEDDGTVLSVSEGRGEISQLRLPENIRGPHRRSTFRFIDGDDAIGNFVRVVSLVGDDLRVFLKTEDDNGDSEWVLARSLHLPEAARGLPGFKESFFSHTAKIVTAGKGYVVLTPEEKTWLFSIELGTMELERGHIRNRLAFEVYPYELQLPPKVNVCLLKCKRGRGGRRCGFICKCN